jgi:hypothetical protein
MTTTITPEAARNAALDLAVINGFLAQIAAMPFSTDAVLADTPAVVGLLTSIRNWSTRAVDELEAAIHG